MFMIRYYNVSGSGKLNFDEFCQMVKDVREAKGLDVEDQQQVQNEAAISAK